VGVAGSKPTPINDVRLPCDLLVDTRVFEELGNGTLPLGVRIMVEGVWVERLGEGGKTNNVWEGVGTG